MQKTSGVIALLNMRRLNNNYERVCVCVCMLVCRVLDGTDLCQLKSVWIGSFLLAQFIALSIFIKCCFLLFSFLFSLLNFILAKMPMILNLLFDIDRFFVFLHRYLIYGP